MSDEDGNYGFPTAPIVEVIEYRYQTEVTSQTSVENMNDEILRRLEKAISDVLVPNLFFEQGACSPDAPGAVAQARTRAGPGSLVIKGTAHGLSETAYKRKEESNGGIVLKGTAHGLSEEEKKRAQRWALPMFSDPGSTSQNSPSGRGRVRGETPGLHRRNLLWKDDQRFLQEDVFRPEDLVGLSSAPRDQVIRGRFQSKYHFLNCCSSLVCMLMTTNVLV